MGKVMSSSDFANKAKSIATNYKTLYIMGCFGAPMNSTNKTRYCNNHSYNKQSSRTTKIKNASSNTFGFDCVCLIKGILWGWKGNTGSTYGGAKYASNGVPDVNANGIMNYCSNVSTNFSNIQVGEVVHMSGHVGIYIGNGLAVECTPIWKDGVQITAVGNIGKKSGYNTRTWTNHGKLNFIDYSNSSSNSAPTNSSSSSNSFLPSRGYFKLGDVSSNVGKIASFMYKTFPAYTKKAALGNTYGPNLQSSIKEFQRRTKLEADGCVGPITLKELKKYGFKY